MSYTEAYESALIRGDQDPLPWNLHEEITSRVSEDDHVVDIGCGTAFKALRFASLVRRVTGVEPNRTMLAQALSNIRAAASATTTVVAGQAERLPIQDQACDVVTVMLAPHSASEVSRILRPGGTAILEKIGDRDKWNVKSAFASDSQGPRGQFADLAEGERAQLLRDELAEHFADVEVRHGFWKTYYTRQALELLLDQTPTVRGFDRQADKPTLDRLFLDHHTDRGLETTQNRLLIIARK
nr:class I SAM-dependent methyltransferase [Kibdelosporangium sp. MJ126-NF4]CEL17353.1 FIG00996192: hypothetical protein [Kibdelosporangium sp. MJ126-NF4]CTQ91420.1 FIG00996192: hypothetical protein [Kibdelosporangium sp. MJ126-NF4]